MAGALFGPYPGQCRRSGSQFFEAQPLQFINLSALLIDSKARFPEEALPRAPGVQHNAFDFVP